MHPEHLRQAIAGLVLKLRASLGASGPLGDSLSKGELREEDVVAAFRPHLPKRYDLVKGVIVDSEGNESDPQDVLLFDAAVLPPILAASHTRVLPVEGVVSTIQVKSNATKPNIDGAIANIASAKHLLASTPRYGYPPGDAGRPGPWSTTASFFGGILCLSGPTDVHKLVEHYAYAVSRLDPRVRPDALCIVDKVAVLWGNPSKGSGLHFAFRAENAETPLALFAGLDSLLFFYMSLVEHINHWITPPISWLDYVFGKNWSASPLTFQYSYWVDDEPGVSSEATNCDPTA